MMNVLIKLHARYIKADQLKFTISHMSFEINAISFIKEPRTRMQSQYCAKLLTSWGGTCASIDQHQPLLIRLPFCRNLRLSGHVIA
jgi:hypothetical protein